MQNCRRMHCRMGRFQLASSAVILIARVLRWAYQAFITYRTRSPSSSPMISIDSSPPRLILPIPETRQPKEQ